MGSIDDDGDHDHNCNYVFTDDHDVDNRWWLSGSMTRGVSTVRTHQI